MAAETDDGNCSTLQALLDPGTYSIVVQSDTAEAINFALTVSLEAGGNPICGNGAVEAGEECDDGNTETETCMYGIPECSVCADDCVVKLGVTSFCGDGSVDGANGEECDDGNTLNGDGCSADCTRDDNGNDPFCGNGNVDAGEECDDGNADIGDGCGQCSVDVYQVSPDGEVFFDQFVPAGLADF